MSADEHSTLRLQDALDGRLTPVEQVALDEHVRGCEPCRRKLHALRWTRVRLAGAAASLEVPPGLDSELRLALRAADSAPPPAPSAPVRAVPPSEPPPPAAPAPGWRRWLGRRLGR